MGQGEVNCTIGQLEAKGATAFLQEYGNEFVANSVWCSVKDCSASARFNQNGTITSNGLCEKDGTRHGSRIIGPRPIPKPTPGEITVRDTRARTDAAQAISDKEQSEPSISERALSGFERVAWGVGTSIIALTVRLRQ